MCVSAEGSGCSSPNESDGMLLVFVTDRDPYVLNMHQCVFCAAEERKSSFERNKYGFQSKVICMYLVKVMLLFIL